MYIEPGVLMEKNYTGSRLIEVTDETILKLKEQLSELQREANPYLVKMEEIAPEMDPFYNQIRELEAEKKKLLEDVAPIRARYDAELEFVEKIDQRAQLIKDKLQPLILKLVEGELGEFEKALQTVERGGKTYVEIVDEIEEQVKAIRARKAKK